MGNRDFHEKIGIYRSMQNGKCIAKRIKKSRNELSCECDNGREN